MKHTRNLLNMPHTFVSTKHLDCGVYEEMCPSICLIFIGECFCLVIEMNFFHRFLPFLPSC